MSVLADLDDVKVAMRIDFDDADDLLVRLIGSATREAVTFMNWGIDCESSETIVDVPEDVFNGIVIMVQQDFAGDPARRSQTRAAAETLWHPYRVDLGV